MQGLLRRNLMIYVFVVFTPVALLAQRDITLRDVWREYAFFPETPKAFQSMPDGLHYTMVSAIKGNKSIIKYDFATGENQGVVLSMSDMQEHTDTSIAFSKYTFNEDQNLVLLSSDIEPIYRRSSRAYFHVYNLAENTLTSVGDGKVRYATFSPDGEKVAYVQDNDIYYLDLQSGETHRVTDDGAENAIINGATDWVYEEEFAFARAFFWSPSGRYISFLRFDERKVPEFSMDVYGDGLYPQQAVFKYPKAGETNAKVTAHIYDTESGNRKNLLQNADYEYIPRLKWTPSGEAIVYLTNRHQNKLELYRVNPANGKSELYFTESDTAYLEIGDNIHFLAGGGFVFTSERDGYNHIYHIDDEGKISTQVTDGKWDVTQLYGVDREGKYVYYQAAAEHSSRREVYRAELKGGDMEMLSTKEGTNTAHFTPGMGYFTLAFENSATPTHTSLHRADGTELRVLEDNAELKNKMAQYHFSAKRFFSFETANNVELNAWMIKPVDFDKDKKYPVLMFVYGGPGSQTVVDEWDAGNGMYFQYLASLGYIVVSVDNRGTGARGRDFKKMTYKQLGKYETIDQIASAQYLAGLDYVDGNRIGIWGWSYGGYMSSNCITQGAGTFKMAIAVAPVTNWRFYDSIYTERYMGTPQENGDGYDRNSPLSHVAKLEGSYLLIHGTGDDNVHVQNTMRMTEALIQADKQFDLFVYPDRNHGIYGGNTRYHLYAMMTQFIQENL